MTNLLKTNKGDCEGRREKCTRVECPIFGTLKPCRDGRGRVKECGDPVGRGLQAKRKGSRAQARATTALGIPRSSLHPGNEENLGGAVRLEVKADAKANVVDTAYSKTEAQSEAQRAIGDHRPFIAVFKPDEKPYSLIVIRTDRLAETVAALVEQLEMTP